MADELHRLMSPTPVQREVLSTAPAAPFVMHQRWQDLLFLHWSFAPEVIQASLPAGLQVDTFEGRAWVAIVPFVMRGIRPRGLPPVPGLSDFLELNLRTYVHDAAGRPGVWFYSLDCNQSLAVWTARTFFHLPYQRADMSRRVHADGQQHHESQRRGDAAVSTFTYRLTGAPRQARLGTLEFFLAERYLLFADTPRGLRLGRVHHAPYPLMDAEVQTWDTHLFRLAGLPEPDRPPDHVLGSPGVSVRIWPLTRP